MSEQPNIVFYSIDTDFSDLTHLGRNIKSVVL